MQNASNATDDSSDGSYYSFLYNNDDSTSYSDGDDDSSQKDSDCICGGDCSDSDWNDCKEPKRAKVEHPRNVRPHDQLHKAIRLHDCRMIRQLLQDGVRPCNSTYKNCRNCFILARRSKFILKKLLEIEPSGIDCQDSAGFTMLMMSKNDKLFKFLCKYKPNVNLIDDYGDNILHHALKQYTTLAVSKLKHLLNLGLDVNAVDSTGETGLTLAIKMGQKAEIIKMLLEKGATLPPPDEDNKTIVMHAIEAEGEIVSYKVDVLKILFEHGANASTKDTCGHNAMYHIISSCFESKLPIVYWASTLEKIIIMLLERNCEVQGLDCSYKTSEIVCIDNADTHFVRKIPVKYDVISALVRFNTSTNLLEELLKRGLYSMTMSNPDVLSPLSACFLQLTAHGSVEKSLRLLCKAKTLFLLGVDATQRIWIELCSPGHTEGIFFQHMTRDNYQEAVARELKIPDALIFTMLMRISFFDTPASTEKNFIDDIKEEMEELLRLLLPFWPHPPLLLMLLWIDPFWCPLVKPRKWSRSDLNTGMALKMQLLAKIGGPMPLGTRYYNSFKSSLKRMALRHGDCKRMLQLLLGLEDGIPSLRDLSRAAFRATVKKTCATGLDFSEFRVLCQGELVPLPSDIVSFLEFRSQFHNREPSFFESCVA